MFDDPKKIFLVSAIAAVILLAIVAVWYILRPAMKPVIQQASQSQIALATQELSGSNIPYAVDETGVTLFVYEKDVMQARALIADLGLPFDQSVGLESFQNSEFGVTEFAQQINYKRALEGELVRTISSLKEVRYARVHLVLPEKGILQKKSVDSSAAVTLFLRDSAQLTQQQIEGIRQLVSSSVPQLSPESVSILNQNGISLDVPDIGGYHGYGSAIQIKRDIERELELRVYNLLQSELEPDSIQVSVNVDLNLDQITRRKEELLADENGKGKIVSSKISKSYLNKEASKKNENNEYQYNYGRLIEEVIVKPGAIARLSAAVNLNREVSDEQKVSLENLIKHALGFSEARRDSLFLRTFTPKSTQSDVLPLLSSEEKKSYESTVTATKDRKVQEKPIDTFIGYYHKVPSLMLALLFMAALVLILLSLLLFKRKSASVKHLNVRQREVLLNDIKQWLQSS